MTGHFLGLSTGGMHCSTPRPLSDSPMALDLSLPNRSNVPFLLVCGGPTATGKTGLSLAIAPRLQAHILSADSRLIYRELNIGTAKPTVAEQAQVPHHLIDSYPPTATVTVAEYQSQAQALIQAAHQSGDWVPWLVGGTGLYIDAVVKGLRIPPVAPQPALRSQLERLGQPHCYALLQQVDAIAAQRIHPNDPVRTIRALEVAYVTGHPLSTQQGQQPPPYPIFYMGLDCEGAALARRIEKRTGAMFEQGLVTEVETLVHRYGVDLPLLKTLGYGEVLGYLAGDYSLAAAQALVVKHTRQFAKRQRTWFRKSQVQWFDAEARDVVDQVWLAITQFIASLTPT
jgi:tRNA dimethylallyltransferase